jgi:hypothetical protein
MSEHRHDIDPRTEAGRKLLAELPYTRDRWLADILAIEREMFDRAGEMGIRLGNDVAAAIEREATSPTADYGGLIAVAENAKREGFPIHVATRTTCQQHIVAGDHMRNAFAFGQSAFDAGPDALALEAIREILTKLIRQYHGAVHSGGAWFYCDDRWCADMRKVLSVPESEEPHD